MRIAELSRQSGVPVPTIKYYLREGLLPAGELTSPNQASYGETHLRRLRLEENAITDAAARDIAGLKDLTYLNLTNTKITDAGFAQVAALPSLEDLYTWGTGVSQPAVDKVKAERKGVTLYAGLTAKDVKPETKVMAPTN